MLIPNTTAPIIKFGADPEYCAGKIIGGSVWVIPSELFKIQGIKYTPDPKHPQFYNDEKGSIIHQDGVALEISVPATTDWRALLKSTHDMQDKIEELLAPYSEFTDGVFAIPAAKYDFEQWNSYGQRMLFSNIFGCDPDYNAFGTHAQGEVVDAATHPWRYFGGHVHFSGHPLFEKDPILSIKTFAITAGLASSAYSPVPVLESERTFLYGKAGKFRVQHYPDGSTGVEYRTPSCTWTGKGNETVAEKLFYYANMAINSFMNRVEVAEKLVDELSSEVQEAILSCNQSMCLVLLSYVESKA
jgi:hypothetical protein